MNQSINTDSKNSKEPQQKYRLGTVSIKILGGLNRFYRRLTSPSASIMAQNIQLFGKILLKYVTNIIGEPKDKYGQEEQVTVRNHNRSTALERSVLKYWGGGQVFGGCDQKRLKPAWSVSNRLKS